jgi:serine protease
MSGEKTAAVALLTALSSSPVLISLDGRGTVAAFSLSAGTVAFGDQPVGVRSAAKSVTLRNTGNIRLSVSGVTVEGDGAASFAQTNGCGSGLDVAAECAINVTFQPQDSGSRTAKIKIASSATESASEIALSGVGVSPRLVVDATDLAFGAVVVGTSSAIKTVTIRNSGNAELGLAPVTLAGDGAERFSISSACGSTLAAGASCEVTAKFTPISAGAASASLRISQVGSSDVTVVNLTGSGNVVRWSPSPATLTFGSQAVTSASAAKSITLTNDGNVALTVSAIELDGVNKSEFSATSTCSGKAVAPSASCAVSVVFTPDSIGGKAASLVVRVSESAYVLVVPLEGTGFSASVSVDPVSLNFGNQGVGTTSTNKSITLRNSGSISLTITEFAVVGTDSATFTQSNDCGTTLAAGASCTITVWFKPTSIGSKAASIRISSSATGGAVSVALGGVGVASAANVSPSALAFGSQAVGTTSSGRTFSLVNDGNAALTISSIAVSGADSAQFGVTNNCGTTVAAGASCSVTVTFAPTSSGAKSAAIRVASNAPGNAAEVAISGTGAAGALLLSATSVSFDSVNAGAVSAAKTLTVRNEGNLALTLGTISLSGTNADQFSQSTDCGSTLAIAATCTVTLRFSPTTGGPKTASLLIPGSIGTTLGTASLTGTGVVVVPGAPTLTGVTAGNSKLTLVFAAPTFNGGSAITKYIGRCIAGGATLTGESPASPVVVTGVANGTAYSCTVLARNSAGDGAPSTAISGTPVGATVTGTVSLDGLLQIDSDTNRPNASQVINDAIFLAQQLYAPFVLVGHVNVAERGAANGRWFTLGDPRDFYRVQLKKDQLLTLKVAAAAPAEGELLMALYNNAGTLVAFTQSNLRQQQLRVPATGDYYILIWALGGASRYILDATLIPGVSVSSAGAAPFVAGQGLVSRQNPAALSPLIDKLPIRPGVPGFETEYAVLEDIGGGIELVQFDLEATAASLRQQYGREIPFGEFESSAQRNDYLTVMASRALAQEEGVKHVTLNHIVEPLAVPNDPGYVLQRWHYEMINLPQAWELTQGSADVTVAVIDSGVSAHPDLEVNLLRGYDFVGFDYGADGNDVEDADASDPGSLSLGDRTSHGTHVAGTVSARGNNSKGASGVAWNVKILPVRVLGTFTKGNAAALHKAMLYSAGLLPGYPQPQRRADVINLSLGGEADCDPNTQSVINQVRAVGVIVVAATGNDKRKPVNFPANCEGVIAVSAVGPNRELTTYSNIGADVDVAAPGGSGSAVIGSNVFSTDIKRIGVGPVEFTYREEYGTSMASPHVAGVAALMKSVRSSLTPVEFDALLESGSLTDDLGLAGKDTFYGVGLINAYKAVRAANTNLADLSARISVSPSNIDFDAVFNSIDVYVSLIGNVSQTVLVSPATQQPWISVSEPVNTDPRTLRYRLTVNRALVADGFHDGTLVFQATVGGSALNSVSVRVAMTKRSVTVAGNAGLQNAFLVDAQSFTTKYQSSALSVAGPGGSFTVPNVAAGSYYLFAGTDIDNDNFFCSSAEVCSVYSVIVGPEPINVDGSVGPLPLVARIVDVVSVASLAAGSTEAMNNPGIRLDGSSSPDEVRQLLDAHGLRQSTGTDVLIQGGNAPFIESAPTVTPATATKLISSASAESTPKVGLQAMELSLTVSQSAAAPGTAVTSGSVTERADAVVDNDESTYRVVEAAVLDGQRATRLERRDALGRTGAQIGLPSQAEVLWRTEQGGSRTMPASSQVTMCSEQVWAVQDGYQLGVTRADNALIGIRSEGVSIKSNAEAIIVTSVSCSDNLLSVNGVSLPVSANGPLLSGATQVGDSFTVKVDALGDVVSRTVSPVEFSVTRMCAEIRGKQDHPLARFCRAAEAALQ